MSSYVWKYPLRSGALFMGLLLIIACSEESNGTGPSDEPWITTVLDSDASAHYSAIAVGGDGNSRIAFIDRATRTLRFARFTGTSWNLETVPGTVEADEGAGIVLDSSDHPHIAWQSENGMRYAHHNGTSWTVEVVENTVVGARNPSLSIALGSGESPAISFYGGDTSGLKYATRSGGGTWSIVTANADLYAGFHGTSLVFDAAGNPMISYHEYSSSALRLASWNGSWSHEVVDDSGEVGQYSSMARDGAGRLHIAYLDATNLAVRYARKETTGWIFEEIGDGLLSPSLGLDSDGTPWVAYIDYAYGYVKVAHRDGTVWTVENASPRTADWRTSMAIGPSDRIHISAYLSTGLVYVQNR